MSSTWNDHVYEDVSSPPKAPSGRPLPPLPKDESPFSHDPIYDDVEVAATSSIGRKPSPKEQPGRPLPPEDDLPVVIEPIYDDVQVPGSPLAPPKLNVSSTMLHGESVQPPATEQEPIYENLGSTERPK